MSGAVSSHGVPFLSINRTRGAARRVGAALTAALAFVLLATTGAEGSAPGNIERMSEDSVGNPGNGPSFPVSGAVRHISDDGRFITFLSYASNLHPDDPDSASDIYVYDRDAGTIDLVSRAGAGEPKSNGDSFSSSISADGRYITFDSRGSNLHPDDTDDFADIYVYDRESGTIDLMSRAGAGGAKSNGWSFSPSISANGRYVAFFSWASNLHPDDTDAIRDIYIFDRDFGTIDLVSRAGAGGPKSNGESFSPAISADGRYVAFYSRASNLHPDDTDNISDIYVFDRSTGTIDLVSRAGAGGPKGNGDSFVPSISGEGRYVAFYSNASNLHPDDSHSASDIYVYDRDAGTIELVSRAGAGGPKGNGESFVPSISANGRYVAFYSRASNLHPDDTDNIPDIYVFDRNSGTIALESTTALGVKGDAGSIEPTLNADGGVLAFSSSAQNLAGPSGGNLQALVKERVVPVGASPSVLFREKADSKKDGTWGFIGDEIPGFDHTALHIDNLVYESHPGYPTGTYVSQDGNEAAFVTEYYGVQAQHTRATFEHDAMVAGAARSPVIDFEEISINRTLAENMRNYVEDVTAEGAQFQFIDVSSLEAWEETLSPSAQKGDGGTFTCVGLVEWAAEQTGHNGGQGFVRDVFEAIPCTDLTVFPPVIRQCGLLSPHLLNYAMKTASTLATIQQWFQGMFDPVDVIVTDPLGRRLGFVAMMGQFNEIPGAFFSGDGEVEQFLIPNPLAGTYYIELLGLDANVTAVLASNAETESISIFLAAGRKELVDFTVELVPGAPGDVNSDGSIDSQDADELFSRLNTAARGPNDPADLNGDRVVSELDLTILEDLILGMQVAVVLLDIKPGREPNSINPKSRGVIPVAMFSTETFHAPTQIEQNSLTFGRTGDEISLVSCPSIQDVNGDGLSDLVCHFATQLLDFQVGNTFGILKGETVDGLPLQGTDAVRIVGK